MNSRIRRSLIAGALVALVASGCGYDDTAVPEPEVLEYTPPAASDCDTDPATLLSEPADGTVGSTVARIQREGLLRVGVSADTYLMASRNPANNRIQGFDIEIVKAIGEAIFGEAFNLNTDVQLRVITAAERIPLLGGPDAEGDRNPPELDLVVRNFTINSCRKEDIDFSAVYYNASQKVLVRADAAADYTGTEDLKDKNVCAPNGTTSLANIVDREPEAVIVPANTHTGCLIKFQRDEVDAITGDDTVLAGLAAQDPYAAVPEAQPALSNEPYGVGIPKGDDDFVAFVNFALEQMVDSGDWQRAYDKYLAKELGDADAPPSIDPSE